MVQGLPKYSDICSLIFSANIFEALVKLFHQTTAKVKTINENGAKYELLFQSVKKSPSGLTTSREIQTGDNVPTLENLTAWESWIKGEAKSKPALLSPEIVQHLIKVGNELEKASEWSTLGKALVIVTKEVQRVANEANPAGNEDVNIILGKINRQFPADKLENLTKELLSKFLGEKVLVAWTPIFEEFQIHIEILWNVLELQQSGIEFPIWENILKCFQNTISTLLTAFVIPTKQKLEITNEILVVIYYCQFLLTLYLVDWHDR